MNKYLFLLVFLCEFCIYSQKVSSIDDVFDISFVNAEFQPRKVIFLNSEKKSFFQKYNPIVLTLGSAMYFYQKVLSPQIFAKCGYEISCSNFSKACIHEFGIIKGVALTADRLTRCTPFTSIDLRSSFLNHEHKIIEYPKDFRLKD